MRRMGQRSGLGWLVWFTWLLTIVVATATGEFALVGLIALPFAVALYALDKREKARLAVQRGLVHQSGGR
jgi:hypothetical protein